MHGAYTAEKLYRFGDAKKTRVLVLDAGALLLPTHLQNLPSNFGSDLGRPASLKTRGSALSLENVIWGLPWISNIPSPGLAYCLGGRSLFWSGWAVPLTQDDLRRWPADARSYLLSRNGYVKTAEEIGSADSTDFIANSRFFRKVNARFQRAVAEVSEIDDVMEAPLAIQATPPRSGLFPFDKFSSVTLLIDAVRQDAMRAGRHEKSRRMFVLPRAVVLRICQTQGRLDGLDICVDGVQRHLPLGRRGVVVVANGTIEASRLVLNSFSPAQLRMSQPRLGNLMAHMRNNVTVRVRRRALGLFGKPHGLETAALLVRGTSFLGSVHFQVWAAALSDENPLRNVSLLVPDLDAINDLVQSQSKDWVSITVRGMAEMENQGPETARKSTKSWVRLSDEKDEWGVRRAQVNLVPTQTDILRWNQLNDVALKLVHQLVKSQSDLQYWDRKALLWRHDPPPKTPSEQFWLALGESHHEAGTLFMGSAEGAMTTTYGGLHASDCVFVVGPAIFPTIGSANPSLTALTLARRTAKNLIQYSVR